MQFKKKHGLVKSQPLNSTKSQNLENTFVTSMNFERDAAGCGCCLRKKANLPSRFVLLLRMLLLVDGQKSLHFFPPPLSVVEVRTGFRIAAATNKQTCEKYLARSKRKAEKRLRLIKATFQPLICVRLYRQFVIHCRSVFVRAVTVKWLSRVIRDKHNLRGFEREATKQLRRRWQEIIISLGGENF